MTSAIFFQPHVPILAAESPIHAVTCITVADRFEDKVRFKLAKTKSRSFSRRELAKGNNILDAAELFASGIFPALVKAGWLRQ